MINGKLSSLAFSILVLLGMLFIWMCVRRSGLLLLKPTIVEDGRVVVTSPPVYCLMVTGYTTQRDAFARKSIQNFAEQSYPNKHLIVINQSTRSLLAPHAGSDNMLEVYMNNTAGRWSLGYLRNVSLQLVPPDAIWTTWDDDDYRDVHYLRIMMSEMRRAECDFLMFQNRVEYNLLNGFAFKLTLKTGLMTFFARHNPNIRYADVSTSEDKAVKDFATKHLAVHVYDNDPMLYVRAIHDSNTSTYVNKNKSEVRDTQQNKVYFENELSSCEKNELNNIIYKYYKQN